MVSVNVSGSSNAVLSPGRGHYVMFLGKILNSHSVFLHPGVQMGTGKFNAGGWWVTLRWTSIPFRGHTVGKFPVASCCRNQDKLWPDGPLGFHVDVTLHHLVHCHST